MTTFDAFLDDHNGPFPVDPTVLDAARLLASWRKTLPLTPLKNGAELRRIRESKRRPACRIVVTTEAEMAVAVEARGSGFPLLATSFGRYDFSPVWRLPVLVVMPDSLYGYDLLAQVAECDPKTLAVIWPGNSEEEILWN